MLKVKKNIANELGRILINQGIIDPQVLKKAVQSQQNENGNNSKTLAQILVKDFKFDHDVIYREVANLYAFRILEIDEESKSEQRIKFIRNFLEFSNDLGRPVDKVGHVRGPGSSGENQDGEHSDEYVFHASSPFC